MKKLTGAAGTLLFTVAITAVSRGLLARDRLIGRVRNLPTEVPSGVSISRLAIPSGKNVLDAVLVRPVSAPEGAVLLICHGIGEVVEHWFAVQQLLALSGVASLVFDYSGYGRSTGYINPSQCERDGISAFLYLQGFFPSRLISVLGFSLGSGIAAALLGRVSVHRLVLCASFTSFKAATLSSGFPRILGFLVPGIWCTEKLLSSSSAPVLVVHGEEDRLFPVRMAQELKACSGPKCELVVVPKLSHDDPYRNPEQRYWDLIASHLA
jgi:uncharacterized protein